jgi:hypothetical protein
MHAAKNAITGSRYSDHLAKFQRARPGATQGRRHEEAEDPSVDEGVDHRAYEPALALGLISASKSPRNFSASVAVSASRGRDGSGCAVK